MTPDKVVETITMETTSLMALMAVPRADKRLLKHSGYVFMMWTFRAWHQSVSLLKSK